MTDGTDDEQRPPDATDEDVAEAISRFESDTDRSKRILVA